VLRCQANTVVDLRLSPFLSNGLEIRVWVKHRSLLSAAEKKAERQNKEKYFCESRQYLAPPGIDTLAKSNKMLFSVIPVKTGIQEN
jgi:hypothetical protein